MRKSSTSRSPNSKFNQQEKYFYTGPVEWTTKTLSPYRPSSTVKPPQALTSRTSNINQQQYQTQNISEQILSKIFGQRLTKDNNLAQGATRMTKKLVPGHSKQPTNIFNLSGSQSVRQIIPSRSPTKGNFSSFKSGFVLEGNYKPTKKITHSKHARSSVSFEPISEEEINDKSRLHASKSRSRSPLSQYSNNCRNPILGTLTLEDGNQSDLDSRSIQQGKRVIDFKPSQELDKFNKKRNYLMLSNMKPLEQLYAQSRKQENQPPILTPSSRKAEMLHLRNKSHIDFSNPNPSKNRERSSTPNKRHFVSINEQGNEMNSILKYKDALPYRDEACGIGICPKINQITQLALTKHHLDHAGTDRRRIENKTQMSKAREMQSSLLL